MEKDMKLIPLIFITLILLVSGCLSGLDAEAFAKASPIVQDFLEDHPNAEILATHFTANQSSMMLDEIREECANPYLEAKDYYRVRFTDPGTSFQAVVWIDWDTKKVECAYKKGEGSDVVEDCEHHHVAKCYGQHVYWFDSCGYKQEKKEYCSEGCQDGACLGKQCQSRHEYKCYDGHVYWYDSCGEKEEKKHYCEYGCENGACIEKNTSETVCHDSDGGFNIYKRGESYQTTEGKNTPVSGDLCYGTGIVKEFYCDGSEMKYEKIGCPLGFRCITGECRTYSSFFCGTSTEAACKSDSECVTGGCSGQVCQGMSEDQVITTCEWVDCHNSSAYSMTCACNFNECIWISQYTDDTVSECVDSDGGRNIYKKGTATSGSTSLSDTCKIDGTLEEKWCVYGKINVEKMECPSDHFCSEGECKPGQCDSHHVAECYSDHLYWFDSCGYKQEKKEYCINGCLDGACIVEEECTRNYEKRCVSLEGEVPFYYVFWFDSCGNQQNDLESIEFCVSGFCEDGECKEANITGCTDSDGGHNYFTLGEACTNTTCETDACGQYDTLNKTLIERYCVDYEIKTENVICAGKCEGGVCVQ